MLIAPAFDMTEMLMWRELPQASKDEIARTGVTYVPSAYADPYPITKHLIEEGRSHLLEGQPFDPGCPVRILQGMRDPDVPWRHSLALVDLLAGADVELTLIKEGDHRLSAPHDSAAPHRDNCHAQRFARVVEFEFASVTIGHPRVFSSASRSPANVSTGRYWPPFFSARHLASMMP